MTTPNLHEVISMARDYNLIPIVRPLLADMDTPIRIFQHFAERDHAFLLESLDEGSHATRYAFIGIHPFLILTAKHGEITLDQEGKQSRLKGGPIEELKAALRQYRSPAITGFPPFTGGAVGFLGYDLLQYYDEVPPHALDDLQMKDIQFMFYDQVIVFDHVQQQILLVANLHVTPSALHAEIEASYHEVLQKLDAMERALSEQRIQRSLEYRTVPDDEDLGDISSNITRAHYINNVRHAQEHIRMGDISQVVLSQRFYRETEVSAFEVYRVLRSLRPSSYMYYLKVEGDVIIGSSPESYVEFHPNQVQTHTFHEKGSDDRSQLSDNLKERHEDEVFFEKLISCLPAEAVSGKPRIRAIKIIAELENESRGLYAGAVGYLGFSGHMEASISSSTLVFRNGKAYVQTGALVTKDTVPEVAFTESLTKAKVLLQAIQTAEQMYPVPHIMTNEGVINQDYLFHYVP
ncbi:anthranilate synthase component 1 [Paenibacillus shirakamiensis]|uniref:Anthranilate synthase component 1 n=1 Tax=Paenibacillus shirakamiensis TaxID=1265935 RepID=A0ABS4JEI2_9BACL|nr:chorismate-binding protein [Paenibacillus shirakamiensis]MBP1999546.1 anthranilate synthase component 1 [Paenibacillus shirakamiensis]